MIRPGAVFVSVPLGIVMDVMVGQGCLSSNAVIDVNLWLNVANHLQQVGKHSLPVLLITFLDPAHLIHSLLIHFYSRVSMGSQCLMDNAKIHELLRKNLLHFTPKQ